MQQGSLVIPGFWQYGAHPPVFARLTRVILDNLASLAACHLHQLRVIKPGCPWLVRLQIVTVIAVGADHRCLTQRFRKIFKGFEKMLFKFLHLLESFLFQVVERSSTRSSTPCGCDTTAGIPSRGNTAACLSRHGRRRAAGPASPFGRRARRLSHRPSAWPRLCRELMTLMLPPLGPICRYLALQLRSKISWPCCCIRRSRSAKRASAWIARSRQNFTFA